MTHHPIGNGAVTDLPINDLLRAALDVGGTKTDVWIVRFGTGETVFRTSYDSSAFASLDDILDRSMLDAGVRPGSVGIVAAGGLRPDGTIKMAAKQVHHWPVFNPVFASIRLGIQVRHENDMFGACAGLRAGGATFVDLLPGVPDDSGPKIVLTFSTGLNHGLLVRDGTIYKAESGHIAWQPVTLMEYHYLMFLRGIYKCTIISIEQAASGGQGFNNAYDFLIEHGRAFALKPPKDTDDLAKAVKELRAGNHGIGKLIDEYAAAGDEFCQAIWNILGSILGQYLRSLILTLLPTGGVYLIGSVADGAADYMLAKTPFLQLLMPPGAMYNELVAQIAIRLVTDPALTIRGALELVT